jgi:hypothetical protein
MSRPLPMLTLDAKLAEIKRLYYQTTRKTVQEDLARALDLLKTMANDEERERAAVYMDGMAQMRSDWGLAGRKKGGTGGPGRNNRKGRKGR